MSTETMEHRASARTAVSDPPGFERFIPGDWPAESHHHRDDGVTWEYTYSRFGRMHGPLHVKADSLSEAKDEIRRRHELPGYRGIRVRPSAA